MGHSTEITLVEPHAASTAAGKSGADFLEAEYTEVGTRTLRDYLLIVRKHRGIAAACFGATLLLTIVATWLTPRDYTASTRLYVPRQQPIQLQFKQTVLNLEEADRSVNGASSFLATQVTALKSRDLAERVIRSQRLAENAAFTVPGIVTRGTGWLMSLVRSTPSTAGTAAQASALLPLGDRLPSFLRPRGWDEPAAAASTRAAESGTDAGAIDPALLDRYQRDLDVQDVRGTDLIEVSFTTKDPMLSAFLASAHTQAYLDANQDAQVLTDSAAMGFLEQQLQQSKAQLDGAQLALSRFAADHPNVAVNQEDKLVTKQIADLSGLLTVAEGDRVNAQTQYEYLTKAKNEPLANYFTDKPAIDKLRLTLLDLSAQRSSMEGRLGPNHPQMVALRRQAWDAQQQLHDEVEKEVEAARSRYLAAQLREDELHKRMQKLQASGIELRDAGAQYDFLKNNLENARALHESLLKQKTETGVHSQLDTATIRVVERPEVPRKPSHPNTPLNLVLGGLAGCVIAGAAIFLREALDDSVKSPKEVEDFLQMPTLAVIPNFAFARRLAGASALRMSLNGNGAGTNGRARAGKVRQDLVVLNEPWSAAAETFRSLRTAVLFSAPADSDTSRVILTTSATTGEGKTVTALNLANALADGGWRVALLDADLRDPACHHALGVDNQRGLSSVLSGRTDLAGVIQEIDAPKLAFIPSGPVPSNPAELVGSARMRDTIRQLRAAYDFLIVDSPPVLPVTDAVVLAREADSVVLVMKGHESPRDSVRRARDQLLQAGANLMGVVVNNVGLHWGGHAFYEHYSGYARKPPRRTQEDSTARRGG